MKSLNEKQMRWLEEALRDWREQALIDAAQAEAIRQQYQLSAFSQTRFFLILLGVILLLLALGQLIAHNWSDISPTGRLLLALLLFLAGSITLARGSASIPFTAALSYAAGVTLALVVVGQVFQLQSSLAEFSRMVLFICLPAWCVQRNWGYSNMMQLLALITAVLALEGSDAWTLTAVVLPLIGATLQRHWTWFTLPLLYAVALLTLKMHQPESMESWHLAILLPFAALYPLAKRLQWRKSTQDYGWLAHIVACVMVFFDWEALPQREMWMAALAALSIWAFYRDVPRLLFALTLPVLLWQNAWLGPMTNGEMFYAIKIYLLLMLGLNILQHLREQKRFETFVSVLTFLTLTLFWMSTHALLNNALTFAVAGGLLFALYHTRRHWERL